MSWMGEELIRCVLSGHYVGYVSDLSRALFMMPDGRTIGMIDEDGVNEGGVHEEVVVPCLDRVGIRYNTREPEIAFMRETGAVRVAVGTQKREAVKPTYRSSSEFQVLTEPRLTDTQMKRLREICLDAEKCFWDVNHASGRRCSSAGFSDDAETSWRNFTQEYRRCSTQ